jgi:hypothetical protein
MADRMKSKRREGDGRAADTFVSPLDENCRQLLPYVVWIEALRASSVSTSFGTDYLEDDREKLITYPRAVCCVNKGRNRSGY